VTVVLSKAGWIRAGKGHELDATTLSYKAGDEYFTHVLGKTNQLLILLDDKGRAYTLNPRELPSARSQGEPVTTRIELQDSGKPNTLLMGAPEEKWLLAGNDGYGFVTKLGELEGRNKAGKAVMNLGGNLLVPQRVLDVVNDRYALATAEGRLLVFPVAELPELAKGKGNKLVTLKGEDHILAACVLPAGTALELVCGKRTLTLKPSDLEAFIGTRASRGAHLPRGFQRVDAMRPEVKS
jgi:topoisomerase-4 subunit A